MTVGRLRDFLSLGVGKPLGLLSVNGYKDDLLTRAGAGKAREPIHIYWEVTHNPKPASRKRHPTEMLFRLSDAEPDIGSMLQTWLARQDVFAPVFELYFAMLYHPSMYNEVQFLLYAQAIETYDFRRRDPHEIDPADHKIRLQEVLDAAPEQWKEWLRTRLLSSNYRTLDQRLRDVLAECPTVSARIIGSTADDQDAFVRAVKNTRNYYTHYAPELEHKAATSLVARYVLTVQLRTVLEMAMLRELGFSCETVDHLLDRAQRYSQIQRVRAQTEEEPQSDLQTPDD